MRGRNTTWILQSSFRGLTHRIETDESKGKAAVGHALVALEGNSGITSTTSFAFCKAYCSLSPAVRLWGKALVIRISPPMEKQMIILHTSNVKPTANNPITTIDLDVLLSSPTTCMTNGILLRFGRPVTHTYLAGTNNRVLSDIQSLSS
jgi:hypothetical protein